MEITDEIKKEHIISCMADNDCRDIIGLTIKGPKPASEIIKDLKIPSSTAYRRINALLEFGILVVERTLIMEDGKKLDLYRSTVRNVEISHRVDNTTVTLIPNEDMVSKFIRLWLDMQRPNE